MVQPDVREALQAIMADPQALLDTFAKHPRTLIHGDYRLDNLALLPDSGELVAYDWQNAAYVPATIGLCWFAMSGGVFHRREEYVDYYRRRLFELLDGRFDQALWPAMLDLGCLFDVLTKGNWHALFAVIADDADYMRQSVDSYNDLVRQGIRWF
jgi:hypothetical protein